MRSRARAQPNLGPIDTVWRLGGEEYLPLRLILVAKLLDLNVARLLASSAKITVAEWRVVAQLGVLHHASVREMARQACIDPAEVSRSVASLERRGYVDRRANPRDRRSPRFSLTASGARHLAQFRPHWKAFQKLLVAKLSHRDRSATEHALALIARASLDLLETEHAAGPRRRLKTTRLLSESLR
ncbi:MAG TPA: MarR family transcriptional regulator [Steroidobacteraceae bacterium]|nr:MarR family transcriptional regulator [Steroidobacteraceae bacterium]